MDELKLEFTQRWAMESKWSYDSPDDSNGELWTERDSRTIALEMLEKGVYFWEHRGWEDSLLYKISPTATTKENSQRLAAKLLTSAPLGYASLNPQVVSWSQGDFSEYDETQAIIQKTLPEWLARQKALSYELPAEASK